MNVLLLEDDYLIADLVETVMLGLSAKARVRHCASLADAKAAWQKLPASLVLCDWHLPDGCGLELIKLIRKTDKHTPVIVISASADRDSVRVALHHGINDFIAKPFDLPMLQKRLQAVIADASARAESIDDNTDLSETSDVPSVEEWLEQALSEKLQLPGALDNDKVLPLLSRIDELSTAELTTTWKNETALVTRLLKLANSASLRRSGKPVSRLDEAIITLGISQSLNCALAMSLDISGALTHAEFSEQAQQHQAIAEQVAAIARNMALSVDTDGASCHTAGLLSRCGELAVLRTLQQYLDQGGTLNAGQAETLLQQWGPRYGNRLKIQWGLPLPLRELIGAVHMAPAHATRKAPTIMHLAGLCVASKLYGTDTERLLQRVGLDPEKWLNQPD
ncbi:response regulator [Oceanimonas sp. MB9]|uniref:response regulator n=1 Tax=Oceanimonas sp. MB9 TaxID=2588453 RepID=UPI0013F5CDD4|nr:Cell cycle response regulator CtrA [Oceanimonas sp. MB9]